MYTVTCDDAILEDHCTCQSHEKYGTCKHLQAVEMHLREQAQVATYEAMMEAAEASTGCDAYAEF